MYSKPVGKKLIAFLFAFSLLVRLLILAIVPTPALDDSAQIYLRAAHLLMDGKGFSDPAFPVYNPPLYPVFIAASLSLLGDDGISVSIVQALVDSFTTILVYLVMREIFDVEAALLSAILIGLYPFSLYLTNSIASEPLFTFFLSGFLLCCVYAVRSIKWRYYFVAGVLLGLATMTRGTTQFVPLMVPVLLILLGKGWRDAAVPYLALCLSFGLVMLPWTVRNYVVMDDIIPVATGGGIVVLMGSSEKFLTIDGKPEMYLSHVPPAGGKPSQNDRFYIRAGLQRHLAHLQADPFDFARFIAIKLARLWYATESGANHTLILLSQLSIYLFALLGVIFARMKGITLAWIPICMVVYFVVLHWLSLPLFRYMIPIMPLLIGLAAFAIVTIKKDWMHFGGARERNGED